ncbi:hypothetical protein K2X05_07170 [bacterium]|nr:hypothetical protein [bacterium]
MRTLFTFLAVFAIFFQIQKVHASAPQCSDIFRKNTDSQQILNQAFDENGSQKIIHIVPNFLRNFERILLLLSDRKKDFSRSGLSIVILPSHSKVDDKKLSLIKETLPTDLPVYFLMDQIKNENMYRFLQSVNGVVFIEANLMDPFLQKLLEISSQNSELRFDGIYLDEKPELNIFLSRALVDQFLLQTHSILYGVSTGPVLQQRGRVINYQNVLVEGQSLVSPDEFMNLSYSFMSPKKPPRRHLRILPWEDFKNLVASKGFKRRKDYIYWVESERPEGVPLHPHISYASEWKGWEHLLGSKWMSFEEAQKVAIAAGIKNQKDFLNWSRRPLGFPSYPKSVYPEFTTWADFLGTKLRASPRLIEILPYEQAQRIASTWARENNIKSIAAYRARKDKPKGLPYDPGTAYKGKGWINGDIFLGLSPASTSK